MAANVAIENTVYRIGGFQVDREIVRYIRDASAVSGISFDYMMAKAGHESCFDSDAAAVSSSAEGIYQFTTETWLQQMKLHGAKYGYAKLAGKIYRDRKGRYRVKEKNIRSQILLLRRSPRIASLLAAEFAKSNKKILQDQIGGDISPADLYLAHFMGPAGAVMLIRADKFTPQKLAADLFPDAALANPPIFYNGKKKMRTVRQVRQVIADIFQDKIERFAVLPKSLKIWLDKEPAAKDRKITDKKSKSGVVVEAPVLRIETATVIPAVQENVPPVPKMVETFQLAKILPGEGVNLDDEEVMGSLKNVPLTLSALSGKNDVLSADFIPVAAADYNVNGVTDIEAGIAAKSFRPVYTSREISRFEADNYMLSAPLPVTVTAQILLESPFDRQEKQEIR